MNAERILNVAKMFTLYSKGKARAKRNYTRLKRIEKVTW